MTSSKLNKSRRPFCLLRLGGSGWVSVVVASLWMLFGANGIAVSADDGISSSGYPDNPVSAATYASVQSCHWPDNSALEAVVPIAGEDGSYASGVVINQNRVLTAAHALSPAHRVYVQIAGQYRQARIMLLDRREDLAMLSVDTQGIVPLPVAAADPVTDEPVWAVGYPRAMAKETTPGRLTRNAAGSLHASASIDLGQSGGGLLLCNNGSYILAGMLRGYGAYVRGDEFVKLKNHSVSVGASTIQRFFDAVPQGTTYSAAMVTR